MSAASAALLLYVVWFLLAFCLRTAVQLRRTGSSGFKGISGRPGSVEWIAGVLLIVAVALGVAAPLFDLEGVLDPVEPFDHDLVRAVGIGLYAGGLVATLAAQFAMGASWRVGVDESERTALVIGGPFAVVRNPIYSGMLPTALGLALLVPNAVALVAVALVFVAIELQVRQVEEPYLLRVHGRAYADYASRVGRFVPGIGRLRPH
jgi:protein-S-isoprenylcysteine O-methyltransferase Ste14